MSNTLKTTMISTWCIAILSGVLSGCAVTKATSQVATLPFKAAYKTTEFVGKTVLATGKGLYYVGNIPVKITDRALDSSTKVLTLTTQSLDATGSAISVTRQIKASQLNAELAAVKGSANILSVAIDAL